MFAHSLLQIFKYSLIQFHSTQFTTLFLTPSLLLLKVICPIIFYHFLLCHCQTGRICQFSVKFCPQILSIAFPQVTLSKTPLPIIPHVHPFLLFIFLERCWLIIVICPNFLQYPLVPPAFFCHLHQLTSAMLCSTFFTSFRNCPIPPLSTK